jgi:hypothetical protein
MYFAAGCSCSSTALVHSRMRARAMALRGLSGTSGNSSSRYSQITVDSISTTPSCTSVGTTASGLSFK